MAGSTSTPPQSDKLPVFEVAGEEAVTKARAALDAHTVETMAWHFHESTGCPFWLEYAKGLPFNPLTDVKGFDDLKKFPPFEDEWLRGGPVRRHHLHRSVFDRHVGRQKAEAGIFDRELRLGIRRSVSRRRFEHLDGVAALEHVAHRVDDVAVGHPDRCERLAVAAIQRLLVTTGRLPNRLLVGSEVGGGR